MFGQKASTDQLPARSVAAPLPVQRVVDRAVDMDHPGLSVPFRLRIDGRWFEGVEISLTQITALGLAHPQMTGVLPVTLHFPFAGFNVDIDTNVEVIEVSSKTGLARFRFIDALGNQRIPLQSVFNAYISGELTQFPGLLGSVAAKPETGSANKSAAGGAGRIGKFLRGTLALAAGVALLLFVVERVHQRVFVITPAGLASISGDIITLTAPDSGAVSIIDKMPGLGMPIAGIFADGGKLSLINMPCVCRIVKNLMPKGGVVEKGQPVFAVMPGDGEMFITAETPVSALPGLKAGASIFVTFSDGSQSLASLRSVLPIDADARHLDVTFTTATPLDPSQLGEPVKVVFDTFPGWWAGIKNQSSQLYSNFTGRG